MEITQKQIDAAYAVATPEQKKVLDALFGEQKDNRPVIERIKSFEDAVSELGEDNPFVIDYNTTTNEHPNVGRDVVAYMRLRIIVAALNEGWKPAFVEDECRWAPYYVFFTNNELDNINEKDKLKICRIDVRSSSVARVYSGIAYENVGYSSFCCNTRGGALLSFKNEELAEYAGRQFIDIYAAMMGIELQK